MGVVEGWEAVPVSGVEKCGLLLLTYNAKDSSPAPSERRKIMILGSGPNRIGQGIEFDYCCVHAAFALRDLGFETIIVNCNPETVSTDYDTSDKLYFEPLTLEDVLSIYHKEKPLGVIAQFGGQTPLNLAFELEKAESRSWEPLLTPLIWQKIETVSALLWMSCRFPCPNLVWPPPLMRLWRLPRRLAIR